MPQEIIWLLLVPLREFSVVLIVLISLLLYAVSIGSWNYSTPVLCSCFVVCLISILISWVLMNRAKIGDVLGLPLLIVSI